MPYDYKSELKRIKDYYDNDPLQKRFSALVTGPTGVGKTFLLSTARKPIHIDSFDPGGSKCLRTWIKKGDVIADTQWEQEDPYAPSVFGEWMKTIDIRLEVGYFKHFGTYCLDSATTFGDAIMNYQLNSQNRPGEAPKFTRDYTPQKILMINYIKKLMALPCDFIMTGHLKEMDETVGETKNGEVIKKYFYRFMATGQAVVTIPLQFDEIYVLDTEETSNGLKRKLIVEAQGKYLARSRLKAEGKLNDMEDADIKKLLKKIGLDWEDKPKLDVD